PCGSERTAHTQTSRASPHGYAPASSLRSPRSANRRTRRVCTRRRVLSTALAARDATVPTPHRGRRSYATTGHAHVPPLPTGPTVPIRDTNGTRPPHGSAGWPPSLASPRHTSCNAPESASTHSHTRRLL